MDIDQDVIKITEGTASTACQANSNQINITKKEDKIINLVIIDSESSESSNDESDIEVVDQYKLEDTRPIIGKFGKY